MSIADLLGVRYPLIQAPMAGSTTPELVAAVSEAGALGSFGGARSSPDELRAAIRAIRALTDRPFAVNLFAPLPPGVIDDEVVARVRAVAARALGADPEQTPLAPPPFTYADQLAVVADERVPVFSFTFGIPDHAAVRATGAVIMGTATTVAEARALADAGIDAIVLQGAEAGGHRGTFLGSFDESLVPLGQLLADARDAVSAPLVAAGGIMDGAAIAAVLRAGAAGAQLGTAFMTCDESAVPGVHQRALAATGPDGTVVTPVLTGRPARAIRTSLVDELEAVGDAAPFGVQLHLLREVYAAGYAREDPERVPMLAGANAGMVRPMAAAALVDVLVAEAGL